MKKVLVRGVLGLALLVILIVGTGYLLPQDHRAASTIRLAVSPDSVWMVVRDLGRYPEWWTFVEQIEPMERADSTGERWRQITRNGTVPFEVVREVPGRLLETRILDDGLPFGGTWTYEVWSAEQGARVQVTEDGSVYNPIFRFMARFVFGYHGTMDDYLVALAGRFGEAIEPEHVR